MRLFYMRRFKSTTNTNVNIFPQTQTKSLTRSKSSSGSAKPLNDKWRHFRHRRRRRGSTRHKTAFDWRAYKDRARGLRLLRAARLNVDTLVVTCNEDFADSAHWQALVALAPALLAASTVVNANTGAKTSVAITTNATISSYSSTNMKRVVKLPAHIKPTQARQLLECAYGERVELDTASFECLYLLAVEFDISAALAVCLDFGRRQLCVSNCVQLLNLALRHKNAQLAADAYKLMRHNIVLLLHCASDMLHALPVRYLRRLLLDDKLRLDADEELAWPLIKVWLRAGSSGNDETSQQTDSELIDTFNRMRRGGADEFGGASGGRVCNMYPHHTSPIARKQLPAARLQQQLGDIVNLGESSVVEPEQQKLWRRLNLCEPKNSDAAQTFKDRRPERLTCLLKCLRFMRFRSVAAFDVILGDELVASDTHAKRLVERMRVHYVAEKRLLVPSADAESIVRRRDLPAVRVRGAPEGRGGGFLDALSLLLGVPPCMEQQHRQRQQSQQPAVSASVMKRLSLVKSKKVTKAKQTTETQIKQVDDGSSCSISSSVYSGTKEIIDTATHGSKTRSNCLAAAILQRARRPRVPSAVALLIGGWAHGKVRRHLLSYDFVADTWFKLRAQLPTPVAFHACAVSPATGTVYVLGGTDGREILASLVAFRPAVDLRVKRCCFRHLAPMFERRCHLAALWHPADGRLYALGGHSGLARLRSAEAFDERLGVWQPIAEMSVARSDAGACVHDNKIFVAGGQLSDQFVQASVEFYKHSDDTWTFVAPMLIPRMAFRLVSHQNALLAIAGTNGLLAADEAALGATTRSVERFVPSLGTWSFCAPLVEKRAAFCALQIAGELVVAGGFDGGRRIKTCEALELAELDQGVGGSGIAAAVPAPRVINQPPPASQRPPMFPVATAPAPAPGTRRQLARWKQRAPLPSSCSGASVAVIGKLSNAHLFTFHGSAAAVDQDDNQDTTRTKNFLQDQSLVKPPSKWRHFKLVRRRTLIRHAKILAVVALIVFSLI